MKLVYNDIEKACKTEHLAPFKEQLAHAYNIGVGATGPLVNAAIDPTELHKVDPNRALLNAVKLVKVLTDICLALPHTYKEEVSYSWDHEAEPEKAVEDVLLEDDLPRTLTLEEIEAVKKKAQEDREPL